MRQRKGTISFPIQVSRTEPVAMGSSQPARPIQYLPASRSLLGRPFPALRRIQWCWPTWRTHWPDARIHLPTCSSSRRAVSHGSTPQVPTGHRTIMPMRCSGSRSLIRVKRSSGESSLNSARLCALITPTRSRSASTLCSFLVADRRQHVPLSPFSMATCRATVSVHLRSATPGQG